MWHPISRRENRPSAGRCEIVHSWLGEASADRITVASTRESDAPSVVCHTCKRLNFLVPTLCSHCNSCLMESSGEKPYATKVVYTGLRVLLIILAMVMSVTMGCSDDNRTQTGQVTEAQVQPRLHLKSGDAVIVARTEEDCEEFDNSITARNDEAFGLLLNSGRIFHVPDGTHVSVISRGSSRSKIRLLSGDHAGEAVWVENWMLEVQ